MMLKKRVLDLLTLYVTIKNLTIIDKLKRVTYNLLKSSSLSPKDS